MEIDLQTLRRLIDEVDRRPGMTVALERSLADAILRRLCESFDLELARDAAHTAAETMLGIAIDTLDRYAGIEPAKAIQLMQPTAGLFQADLDKSLKLA